jgi:hypothetical protein
MKKTNNEQFKTEYKIEDIAEQWVRLILTQIKNEPKIPRKYRGNSWVKLR